MRFYSIYKVLDDGREFHFVPELQPMTHKEALKMRSVQTNPRAWGIKEVSKYSAKKTREYMREFHPGFRFIKASQAWKGKSYPYCMTASDVEGEMAFFFEHTKEVKK